MLRKMFALPIGLFVVAGVLLVLGFAANAPALLLLSLMCGVPFAMLTLGYALGRFGNNFQVVEVPQPYPPQSYTQNAQPRRRRDVEIVQ